jgi:hypothetical protein
MKKRKWIAAAAALMVASSGLAQAKDRLYVLGPGANKCSTWTRVRKSAKTDDAVLHMAMLAWAQGAASTVAMLKGVPFREDDTSVEAEEVALDAYCKKNPNEMFVTAPSAILKALADDSAGDES